MGVITDADDHLNKMKGPLHKIEEKLDPTVDDIIETLKGTEVLERGTGVLTDALADQSAAMSGLTVSTRNGTFVCAFCSNIATRITEIKTQIQTKVRLSCVIEWQLTYIVSKCISIALHLVGGPTVY